MTAAHNDVSVAGKILSTFETMKYCQGMADAPLAKFRENNIGSKGIVDFSQKADCEKESHCHLFYDEKNEKIILRGYSSGSGDGKIISGSYGAISGYYAIGGDGHFTTTDASCMLVLSENAKEIFAP
jgi:hypothetical protein